MDVWALALCPWQQEGSLGAPVLCTIQLPRKLRQDLLEWDCTHRGDASSEGFAGGQKESHLLLHPTQ